MNYISRKKIVSITLSFLLILSIIPIVNKPIVVKAADGDKTVACLSTDAIKSPKAPENKDSAWTGSYVWYGVYGYPMRYRVLDPNTNKFGEKTMFLDGDMIFLSIPFNRDHMKENANVFSGSDIESYLNGYVFLTKNGVFTEIERGAIAYSNREEYDFPQNMSYICGPNRDYTHYTKLENDKIFVLDVEDVLNPNYGYSDYCGLGLDGKNLSGVPIKWDNVDNRKKYYYNNSVTFYFLRNSCRTQAGGVAAVHSNGSVNLQGTNAGNTGVSPAFNIDLSKVLFSSIVTGTAGEYNAEYKLTLLDNNLSIEKTSGENVLINGDYVSVPYTVTGTDADNATQVSVLILDDEYKACNSNSANILYYGELSSTGAFSTTGTGTFDFSETNLSLEDWGEEYRVYIVAEDVNTGNDGKETDYASVPLEISIPYNYKYIVSFDDNGGEGTMSNQGRTLEDGVKLSTNEFTREGYKFIEWNTSADGNGTAFAEETIDDITTNGGTITLYAQWKEIISYDVTFRVKNGSWDDGTKADKSVNLWKYIDEDLALVLNPADIPVVGSKPDVGFMIGSWDNEPSTNATITEDKTFVYSYAVDPNAKIYSIIFNPNGGLVSPSLDQTGYDGKLASIPIPKREGFDFLGWFTEEIDGTEITTDTVFDSPSTIYAHWKAHSYTVKFDSNGGNGTMPDMTRVYDDMIPLSSNSFTLEGSEFSGWNTSADGSGISYPDGATDNITNSDGAIVTLYAMWDSVTYTVIVTNDGKGTATASATSGIKGTNITLVASPNEGYKFARWEVVSGGITLVDATSATTSFSIGTENVEIKATFEEMSETIPEKIYTINFNPNGGSGEMADVLVEEGCEYVLPTCGFTAPEGKVFERWDLGNVGDAIIVTADTDIFAQWKDNVIEPFEPNLEPEVENFEKPDWLEPYRTILHIAGELGDERIAEFSGDFALPYEFMLYLKEHPMVTLKYHVTYEDVEYLITIQGNDAIANPDIEWYGPLWLLANYGGNDAPNGAIGNGSYIVKHGDTLTGISVKLGVTVKYLVDKNGINNPDYIVVGQVIYY